MIIAAGQRDGVPPSPSPGELADCRQILPGGMRAQSYFGRFLVRSPQERDKRCAPETFKSSGLFIFVAGPLAPPPVSYFGL